MLDCSRIPFTSSTIPKFRHKAKGGRIPVVNTRALSAADLQNRNAKEVE